MIIVGLLSTILIQFFVRIAPFATSLIAPPMALAQQDPSTPVLSPPEVAIATSSYFQLLDLYRTKEQQFFIAREQYKQVQTLASLEDTSKASREVQLARIDTLVAYFQSVRATVLALKGVELTKQSASSNALQSVITELGIAKNQISKAQDRIALDKTSAQYEDRSTTYASLAYDALALIKIANMQSATDQLGVLTSQVFDQVQQSSPSASVLAEKQRGYDELARTIADIKNTLQQAGKRMDTNHQQAQFTSSSYGQIIDILEPGFSTLTLAESFLKELAK